MGKVSQLIENGSIKSSTCPSWLASSIQYETITGSQAYGIAQPDSDFDIYGFCIPPKHIIFPHEAGVIIGFDTEYERFDQWSLSHIVDITSPTKREHDFQIYNIVKYFYLCMNGNPNMVDSLFTGEHCVVGCTRIGRLVKDKRKLFLSAKMWHTFKGYAYAQLNKLRSKTDPTSEARKENIEKHGYDVKFAYHVVRLILEVEQALLHGDIDLTGNVAQLRAIREGEWELERVFTWFSEKELQLEQAYANTKLPYAPNVTSVKDLLLQCLEEYYGSLKGVVQTETRYFNIVSQIQAIVRNV